MVTIYTFPECPYCKELKEIYDNEGIEYRDVDINLPENYVEFGGVMEVSKAEEVPVIKIGQQLLIPNVSFQSIREAADLTKKFLA
jgi:glutaredoxin